MYSRRCCQIATNRARSQPSASHHNDGEPDRLKSSGRYLDVAGWGVAGSILALVPKCPVCLAAYVMVWTGVWLPFTTATYLRVSLLFLCVAALLFLAAKFLFGFDIVKEAVTSVKDRFHTIRSREAAQWKRPT
jgi:hypothetical protein